MQRCHSVNKWAPLQFVRPPLVRRSNRQPPPCSRQLPEYDVCRDNNHRISSVGPKLCLPCFQSTPSLRLRALSSLRLFCTISIVVSEETFHSCIQPKIAKFCVVRPLLSLRVPMVSGRLGSTELLRSYRTFSVFR